MTLTKRDIVDRVLENVRFRRRHKGPQLFLFRELDTVPLSRKRAAQIVDSLFEKIKEGLARGEDVRIFGFGRFQVRFKWPRKGRNPQTGEAIIIGSRRRVSFKAYRKLRDRLNPRDG
ncbi:MAG: integration host factor subunit alpha [Deltaproteobacteria bacterium]|nr:integration host factor subunit alpha [Deltaproteobacteria bacterium]MBW2050407.1 integration host factor subunit alpha [Deltaproteobacteria bacterium]MBW2111784.1 integration host factor subunit alpha [Deltaproteobacteria bacterium]MBW2354059.1 integration host factor subunit alpha [Deltaproteobacteria bacterium]